MKKQIVQLLHNLIGNGIKSDGKTDANKYVSPALSAAEQIETGSVPQEEPSVQLVDQRSFEKIVNECLEKAQGQGCLLIGDVDRCRDINDMYGRDTGDAVLRNTASVLCDVFRGYVRIGSRGSDTFALWLPDMSGNNADTIRKMTGIVNDRLLHPIEALPPSSLSVGVSFYKPGEDCRSLVKKAHKALCIVKENGRCGCEILL